MMDWGTFERKHRGLIPNVFKDDRHSARHNRCWLTGQAFEVSELARTRGIRTPSDTAVMLTGVTWRHADDCAEGWSIHGAITYVNNSLAGGPTALVGLGCPRAGCLLYFVAPEVHEAKHL